MSFPRSSRLVPSLLPLAVLMLVAAAEPPGEGVSTAPASAPEIAETVVPGTPVDPGEIRIHEPLQTRPTPAASPADRGGLETIGGDPERPRTLTPGQLAKLARAREAVARSRAAGTRVVLPAPDLDLGPPLSLEAIEAMKLEKLRAQQPLPYDPAGDAPGAGKGK